MVRANVPGDAASCPFEYRRARAAANLRDAVAARRDPDYAASREWTGAHAAGTGVGRRVRDKRDTAAAGGERRAGRRRAPRPGGIACQRADEIFGPSLVPHDAYASRTGVMATRFSQLSTSMQRPLEECGLRTVLQRLVSLRCDDGSNPFDRDMRAAHASRRGSMGAGGRCEQIIDVYEVRCPEKTYEVHADMYFCTEGVQSQLRRTATSRHRSFAAMYRSVAADRDFRHRSFAAMYRSVAIATRETR